MCKRFYPAQTRGLFSLISQARLDELNPSLFSDLTDARSTPAIIDFDLTKPELFHPSTLSNLDPDAEVSVRVYKHDRALLPRHQWTGYCDYLQMTIENYVTKVADGSADAEKLYLALFEVGELRLSLPFKPFLDRISDATGLRKREHNDVNLWISPPQHCEALHYDGDDGTLLQFHGRKTITLVPPNRSRDLYPFPIFGSGMPSNFSKVDIDQVDEKIFPRANRALESSMKVTLDAGQCAFIPAGWWHQVEASENPEGVVSVNRFWFTRHARYLTKRPRAALIALTASAFTLFRH